MHGTEFVMINDLNMANSHAIMLRSTAVIQKNDESTILSLQSLEVFSCEISNIETTSLSILDPTTLHLDVFQKNDEPIKMDLCLNQIRMRLSYNDYLLLHSLAGNLKTSVKNIKKTSDNIPTSNVVETLEDVGLEVKAKKSLFWRAYPLSTISQEDIIPSLPKLIG